MRLSRRDPGPCPICDAAHCACGGGGPIEVVQLPARDAAVAVEGKPRVFVAPRSTSIFLGVDLASGPDRSVEIDGRSFSTATYRGRKNRKR